MWNVATVGLCNLPTTSSHIFTRPPPAACRGPPAWHQSGKSGTSLLFPISQLGAGPAATRWSSRTCSTGTYEPFGIVLSNCACSKMSTSWKKWRNNGKNGIEKCKSGRGKKNKCQKNMQLKNATLKETKLRNGENAKKKCKSHQRPTGQTWFRKSCKKLGKSEKKMQIRPGTN